MVSLLLRYAILFLLFLLAIPQITSQQQQSLAQQYSDKATEYWRQHDYKAAFEWYTKAANMGDDGAQTALGHMYAYAKGVSQDYTRAFYWWSKAAQKHNATAEHNLAVLYSLGAGVPQNYNRYADWLAQSAKDGNVQSMYEFGRLLSKPIMFPTPDKQGALYWLGEAANRGHMKAAQLRQELTKQWVAEEALARDQSHASPLQQAENSCGIRKGCIPNEKYFAEQAECAAQRSCVNNWLLAHGYMAANPF
jgi:TPR repeat protein